ncbi:MAG: PCMD domain-containing protein [Rikenellaceae bacterium]|nr:PCMD domain-containing protein [Rikenellaceae bacterium]
MKLLQKILFAAFVALCSVACIENDVPYPRLDCSLTEIDVTGAKEYTTQNSGDTTIVVLDIEESVDLRKAEFVSIGINNQDKAQIRYADGRQVKEGDKWNLRVGEVLYSEVYGYRTYYRFVGVQTVEKRFRVEGQIGESYFEENEGQGIENRIALVNVAKGTDFSAINVLELKLGPEGETTLSPDIQGVTDFSSSSGGQHIKEVTVTYRDVTQRWRIIIQEVTTSVVSVNAWATSADVNCAGTPDEAHSIEYRVKDSEQWIAATLDSDEGGVFKTTIKGLTPQTEYECRALSGDSESGVVAFTTEGTPELPGGDFENWHKNGKVWFPYAEGATPFWDSGNVGATTLGDAWNITNSREDPRPGSSGRLCARMQSAFPSMMGLGKFAAGNIYTGRFAELDGLNGVVEFGQPFSGRPAALHGWYKCNVGQINKTGVGAPVTSGPDRFQIMICLTTDKHSVNTNDQSTFFDCKTNSKVVAWGEILGTESVEGWTEFTLPLKYVKPNVRPNYIIIIATASSYGDYFTGSTDSWMCVDDFELIY